MGTGHPRGSQAGRRVAGLLLPLALLAASALADGTPDLRIDHQVLTIAGKQVPLPDRPWVVTGSTSGQVQLADGPVPIDDLVLLGPDKNGKGDAVTAFVVIHANLQASRNGWGISRDCQGTDSHSAAVIERRNGHYQCTFVQELHTGPNAIPPASSWPQAVALAARRHWRLPDDWAMAGFRIADRMDLVDVRYGFDPRAMGGSGGLDPEAARQGALQALGRWQVAALYLVERGFRNQLDGDPPLPLPRLDGQAVPSLAAASRLRRLAALRDAGWLSAADYSAQREVIGKDRDQLSDLTVNIWRLGALKTAGHTMQTTFWMWGINYLFMGNVYLAGGLALTKAMMSPIRYYLEELAWNTWGPRRNPDLPVVDFSPPGAH